jgi:hypothetical protein
MHTARLCGDHADGPAQLAGERSGAGSLGSALVVGPKHDLDLGRQYDPLEKKVCSTQALLSLAGR